METGNVVPEKVVPRKTVLLVPPPFRLFFSWAEDSCSNDIIARLKARYASALTQYCAEKTHFEVFQEQQELISFLEEYKLDPQHALEFRDISLSSARLWKYVHYSLPDGEYRGTFPRNGFGVYGVMIESMLAGSRLTTAANQIFADCVACSTKGNFPWKALSHRLQDISVDSYFVKT